MVLALTNYHASLSRWSTVPTPTPAACGRWGVISYAWLQTIDSRISYHAGTEVVGYEATREILHGHRGGG